MKYSFVFVLCLGALVMQCSSRPQSEPTSPPPETIMTDAETPSEVTEQVVFEENQNSNPTSDNQDEEEAAPVTTDLPRAEQQQDDAPTTMTPCTDGNCGSGLVTDEEATSDVSTDLPTSVSEPSTDQETAVPAGNDETSDDSGVTTTETSPASE